MSVLTENCVLSRTRAQDLKSVRKLNCWGSELEDVSIVRKMSHVEVLSLSVNNISTLADFAHCKNLQELYIRKNNIQDLNEVLYLKDLPKLKNLWLADNPCAENEQYRFTVLRHLPNLQKLDNQNVQCQEVERAKVQGLSLNLPVAPSEATQNEDHSGGLKFHQPTVGAQVSGPQNGSDARRHSVRPKDLDVGAPQVESPNKQQNTTSASLAGTLCKDPVQNEDPKHVRPHGPVARSPVPSADMQQQKTDFQQPQQPGLSPAEQHAFLARVQTLMDHSGRKVRRSAEVTCDPITMFEGEDGSCGLGARQSLNDSRRYASVEYLHSHSLDTDTLMSPVESRPPLHVDLHRVHKGEKGSPTRLLPKGGKNRNANILSAVLCLIKELDYASLEVVETAIHCRMEEMDG
ncbi:uncharacterized protein F09G8.5-like [Ornithodoros turicata]